MRRAIILDTTIQAYESRRGEKVEALMGSTLRVGILTDGLRCTVSQPVLTRKQQAQEDMCLCVRAHVDVRVFVGWGC